MRGKSSLSKSKNGGIVKLEKLNEPHLSGANIRILVKQLSTSRAKDSSNSVQPESLEGGGNSSNNSFGSTCDGFSDQKQEKCHLPPQPPKKQVRRRLHTRRPYQEKLLNMAEARREIVTALKFHRAAMKQAGERHQPQQQMESKPETHQIEPSSHQLSLEQEAKLKSRRNPRIYASNSSVPDNFPSSYLDSFSSSPGFSYPYWQSISPIAPLPHVQENFNFTLPSQTLGLNLNLQVFKDLETTFYCSSNASSVSSASTSSPSTTCSPLSATTEEIPCMGVPSSKAAQMVEFRDSLLHPVMDDNEIAEIRSIGDQCQMEWNDTLNSENSASWFNLSNTTEITPENPSGHDFVNSPFDEAMEFPAWINTNDSCLQHVNDFCLDNNFEDSALPCMDIEEIQGMGVDWLA